MDPRGIIAEIKIRTSLGQSWFYEIKNSLMIGATLKVIFNLNIFISSMLAIFSLIGFYLAGSLDLDKFKITQRVNEKNTSKYNPHLNKIDKLFGRPKKKK